MVKILSNFSYLFTKTPLRFPNFSVDTKVFFRRHKGPLPLLPWVRASSAPHGNGSEAGGSRFPVSRQQSACVIGASRQWERSGGGHGFHYQDNQVRASHKGLLPAYLAEYLTCPCPCLPGRVSHLKVKKVKTPTSVSPTFIDRFASKCTQIWHHNLYLKMKSVFRLTYV